MMDFNIHRRLIITVIGLMCLVIAAIAYLTIRSSQDLLRQQAIRALTEQSDKLARALDTRLAAVTTTTSVLGSALSRQQAFPLPTLWQIGSNVVLDADTLIDRVTVYTREGRIGPFAIFEYPPIPSPMAALTRLPYGTGDLLPGPLDHTQVVWYGPRTLTYPQSAPVVMSAAIPYFSFEEQPLGLVWVDVPVRAIERELLAIMTASPESSRGYGVLVSDTGVPVATYHITEDTGFSVDAPEARWLLDALPANAEYAMLDGEFRGWNDVLVTSSLLPQTGWRLVSALPGTLVGSPVSLLLSQVLLVALVGMIAVSIVVWQVVRQRITVPLRDLAISAQQIGSGDMRYQISYRRHSDEIGVLARALEDMRINLLRSYEELSRWGRTLEQRVDQRTQEVEQARQEAQATAAELQIVYDASLAVVSDHQLAVMLQNLVERITTLLPASYAAVWLVTSDKEHMQMVASTAKDSGYLNIILPIDQGLAGLTIRECQPYIMEDYGRWPARLHMDNAGIEQALSVPLVFFNKPIGAVVAGRRGTDPVFTPKDRDLLTLFANLVSPVVRNAQLYVRLGEAMQETHRANAVKTRFLASVTHELRTPLNLIINNMDFMRIGEFGPVTDEQVMRLSQTIRSAEHLLYLINDLLDISKIEAGEMQLFIQMTDPYSMIEDALDTSAAMIDPGHPVSLKSDVPENLPQVPMDGRRIRQVLTNLLSNAIKFTPAGEVHLKVHLYDEHIEFQVTDTGIGIPSDEISRLFKMFERTTTARQMGIEGTGLGLPISRYLVEAHGGRMTVDTAIGKGSTFTFTLPLNQPGADDFGKRVTAIMERLEI